MHPVIVYLSILAYGLVACWIGYKFGRSVERQASQPDKATS